MAKKKWSSISIYTYYYPHGKHEQDQSLHFADDACLVNIQNTIFKINRSLKNKELTELSFWLNANKIIFKVASATFLQVCFVFLKESTFETRKSDFYFM